MILTKRIFRYFLLGGISVQAAFGVSAEAVDCADTQTLMAYAHSGDQAGVQAYHTEQCPINISDSLGFTLYDVATLRGDTTMRQWLVDRHVAGANQYSPQMLRFIQTGLRFLNFDAGVVDGTMNEATREGIRDYQRHLGLAATGEIEPQWTSRFYQQLTRKMQQQLGQFGFSAGPADGILGDKTLSAMRAFRQARQLSPEDYPYIDDLLIYQLMIVENDARKEEIVEREKERQARLLAQQQAAKRAQAQRAAAAAARAREAERLRQTQTAEIAARQQAEADAALARQKEQARLAVRQQAAEAAKQRDLERLRNQQAQMQALQAQAKAEKTAREQAELKARMDKLVAEHEAAQARVRQAEAEKQRLANEQAQRERALARQQAQQTLQAQQAAARSAVPSARSVQTAQTRPQNAASRSGSRVFNKVSGRLVFASADGAQCTVGGQSIDGSWCRTYYPSGANRNCDAIVSNTGIVVSLRCK